MDLACLRSSPFEVALAQPNAQGVILNRDIYEQRPLEVALLHGYRSDEILQAVKAGNYPEDFREMMWRKFMSGEKATEEPWWLWRARISPRLLTLDFYRPDPDYDAGRNGLAVFDQGEDAEALAAKGMIQDRIRLTVADVLSLGLIIRRPEPELLVDLEVSSSGPGGTHNLRVTAQEGEELVGTLAFSLLPETKAKIG